MANLNMLIHRGFTTTVIKKVDDIILKRGDDDVEAKMLSYRETLRGKYQRLDDLNDKILTFLTGEKDINDEIEKSGCFEILIQECLVKIDQWISEREIKKEKERLTVNRPSRIVQLPKQDLMRFAGNPLEWPTFWDVFQSLMGKNKELDNVLKLNYLIHQLDGPAADC